MTNQDQQFDAAAWISQELAKATCARDAEKYLTLGDLTGDHHRELARQIRQKFTTKVPAAMAGNVDAKESIHCRRSLAMSRAPKRFARPPYEDPQATDGQTAAPKTPKAPATGAVGRTSKFEGKTIVALVTENPRRENTHGHKSFAIILKAGGTISYADFKAKGGRPNDLQWDIDHNNAKLEG